jgi:hypothetical protein
MGILIFSRQSCPPTLKKSPYKNAFQNLKIRDVNNIFVKTHYGDSCNSGLGLTVDNNADSLDDCPEKDKTFLLKRWKLDGMSFLLFCSMSPALDLVPVLRCKEILHIVQNCKINSDLAPFASNL